MLQQERQHRRVFPSCSQSDLSSLLIYTARRGCQGCLQWSWKSPHANEGLCLQESWLTPCISHGSPYTNEGLCLQQLQVFCWVTRGKKCSLSSWVEMAAVAAKVQCKLLARALPSVARVMLWVQSKQCWHEGNWLPGFQSLAQDRQHQGSV
jgi:hypothetical protein